MSGQYYEEHELNLDINNMGGKKNGHVRQKTGA